MSPHHLHPGIVVSYDENQRVQRAADTYISLKLCHLEVFQD